MGGVPGYGRVEPEENEPVFHSEWEGRVFGLVTTVRGGFSRKRLEALDPDVYLAGYYQRWMIAFEHGLLERGIVSEQELEAKTEHFRANPDAGATQLVDSQLTERVRVGMYRQSQLRKSPPDPPALSVGDSVRARIIEHAGHTRLPRYVQGKLGTVHSVYAAYDFPDDTPERETVPLSSSTASASRDASFGASRQSRSRPCTSTCSKATSNLTHEPVYSCLHCLRYVHSS